MAKDDEKQLKAYAEAAGTKYFASQSDLDPKDRAMPEMAEWCKQHEGIVVLQNGLILTNNPTSRDVINCKTVMRSRSLRPVKVAPANAELIQHLIDSLTPEVMAEAAKRVEFIEAESFSSQQQRLRTLIKEAIEHNVSDIHIEVRPDVARIRFRKYGEMYLHAEWFPRLGRETASVAFNKETDHATAHFNPLVPQNASMPLEVDATHVRLRLASVPAHGGFDLVMRILSVGDEERKITLDDLGYLKDQIYIIKRAIQMPHGAVLIAGPTGSGKTTTLASCLQMVKDTRKVYSIEDPVEKVVVSATQVPVNADQIDRTFASFGRAALRMDPDYIILGEMRDEDTVRVMIRAALTGHLVMSTVHTNSATGIVTRLVDMNISPVMLSDAGLLVCLMFQRLVAKLCDHCKQPLSKSKAHAPHLARWTAVFGDKIKNIFARGETNCPKCDGVGLSGRTVVAEVIWIDEPGREFIGKSDMLGWEKYLKEQGWVNYKEHTMQRVYEGIVDPFDAEAVVGEINTEFAVAGFDYRKIDQMRGD